MTPPLGPFRLLGLLGLLCLFTLPVFAAKTNKAKSSSATAKTDRAAAQDTPPCRWVIEPVENQPLAECKHWVFSNPYGPLLAPEQPFTAYESGLRIRRVSSVRDLQGISPEYPYEGNPGRGVHNGYSKFSAANVTGEYVIAFGVQPWVNGLYRVADGTYMGRLMASWKQGLGETYDVRWDLSGEPGTETTIYYTSGKNLFRQDVLKGAISEEILFTFDAQIVHEGHMDQSTDAHYRGVTLDNNTTLVFDLKQRKPLPVIFPRRGYYDVSPSGHWFLFEGDSPARIYRIDALTEGDQTWVADLPTTSHGHDGWAWDRNGNEVYCYQDNKTDWLCAFNPDNGRVTRIINMVETGYGFNQHMARMINPLKKGWLLLSTYGDENSGWAGNQLLMLEIAPADQHPRIWRLGSTYNKWALGTKAQGYFAESFACLDPAGNNIYWGNNWMGSDNLELFRMELPPAWHETLANGNTPDQLPHPDPTPTPKPTPSPTPTPAPGGAHAALTLDGADSVSAPAGAWVTLYGVSFGPARGDSAVWIDHLAVTNYASWSNTRIDFQVPAEAETGPVRVRVGGAESNYLPFTVRQGNLYQVAVLFWEAADDNAGTAEAPWLTLARAADAAQAGDTVYVRTGTYNESLQALASGRPDAPILFKAYPGDEVILDGKGLPDDTDALVTPADEGGGYQTFAGFTLQHYDEAAVASPGGVGCGFYSLLAQNNRAGLRLSGVRDSIVQGCQLIENIDYGLMVDQGSENVTVADCRTADLHGWAGFIDDSSTSGTTFVRCRAEGNGGDGFQAEGEGVTLAECTAIFNDYGLKLLKRANVRNMLVYHNTLAGVLCRAGTGLFPEQRLVNCTLADSGQANLEADAGVALTLQNVISVGSTGPCLSLHGAYEDIALDRVILHGQDPSVNQWIVAGDPQQPVTLTLEGTDYGPDGRLSLADGRFLAVRDPDLLFIDYSVGDLHLGSRSAARDFGLDAGAPGIDLDRLPRSGRGPADAGAYEFDSRQNAVSAWCEYE